MSKKTLKRTSDFRYVSIVKDRRSRNRRIEIEVEVEEEEEKKVLSFPPFPPLALIYNIVVAVFFLAWSWYVAALLVKFSLSFVRHCFFFLSLRLV